VSDLVLLRVVVLPLVVGILGAILGGLAVYVVDGRNSKSVSPARSPIAAVATPAPDRVVSVNWLCNLTASDGRVLDYPTDSPLCHYTPCDPIPTNGCISGLNVHQELTVRTAAGTTYRISVPSTEPVNVGDPWPMP